MLGTGVSSLFGDLDVRVETDAPLGAMTWIGIGGHADLVGERDPGEICCPGNS